MSSPRPAPPKGKATGPLPAVALALSFVVGPLGAALGGWHLARRSGSTGRSKLALAAVVVGIVQTVVVTGLVVTGAFSAPGNGPAAASGPAAGPPSAPVDYPTAPPPSGPVREPGSPTAGPAQPSGPVGEPGSPAAKPAPGDASPAASLEEFVPEETGGYRVVDKRALAREAIPAGATRAERATYKDADDEVDAAMAEWPTPEAAEAFTRSRGQADFPGVAPLGEGPIGSETGSETGYYWYYEKDGVGTVYWHQGRFSATFTGEPYQVQEFFLSFPK